MKNINSVQRTLVGNKAGFGTDIPFFNFKGKMSAKPTFKITGLYLEDIAVCICMDDRLKNATIIYHKGRVDKPDVNAPLINDAIYAMMEHFSEHPQVKAINMYFDYKGSWMFSSVTHEDKTMSYVFQHAPVVVTPESVRAVIEHYSDRAGTNTYQVDNIIYLDENKQLARTTFPYDIMRLVGCVLLFDFHEQIEDFLYIDKDTQATNLFLAIMLTKVMRSLATMDFCNWVYSKASEDVVKQVLSEIFKLIEITFVDKSILDGMKFVDFKAYNEDIFGPSKPEEKEEVVETEDVKESAKEDDRTNKGSEKNPIFIDNTPLYISDAFTDMDKFVFLVNSLSLRLLFNSHEYLMVDNNSAVAYSEDILIMGVNESKFLLRIKKEASPESFKQLSEVFIALFKDTPFAVTIRRW